MLDRRLLLVSGKGGVGKSAVSAAFAILAARRGKRVLALAMTDRSGLAAHLGVDELTYDPIRIGPGLYAALVDRSRALDEYLGLQLHMPRSLPTRQLSNALSVLADTAPGIREIVTMGKPMGNGHPVSAVVTRNELVNEFGARGRYFNTFGGNPVSCAAALAVLDVIEEEELQSNALDVGMRLVDGLWELANTHDCIGDVRGTGLFLALELVTDRDERCPATELAARVVNDLRDRGVLTSSIGPDANILKLRPPMVLSAANADQVLATLAASLESLSG